MKKIAALALLTLALQGCAAIAALPIAEQIPIYTGLAAAGFAGATFAVTADHDCREDGGCRAIGLPP